MLFTFPSRYWFTIGHRGVFSLGSGSSLLPTGFLVSRRTQDPHRLPLRFDYRIVTFSDGPFQAASSTKFLASSCVLQPHGQSSMVWASSVSLAATREIACLLSLPPGTKMFQFPGSAFLTLWIQVRIPFVHKRWVPPFGHLRIKAYLQLPEAFRRSSRPSSALGA